MQFVTAWGDVVLAAMTLALFALWLGWKYRTNRHDCYTAVGAGVMGAIVLVLGNYWAGWKASSAGLAMGAIICALIASSWLERR